MNQTLRSPDTLVLNAGDMPGTELALKRTYSDPKVLKALASASCLAESTTEFKGPHDVQVRSSAEVYADLTSASRALSSFVVIVARQQARDWATAQIGDESAFFVAAILARRRRFKSYAACWRTRSTVGKLTLVGPADHLDKAFAERLARNQAAKANSDPGTVDSH